MNANIEALARDLDGRQIDDQILRVTGVHVDHDAAWVQVTLEPDGHDLVLHIHADATPADALTALESRLHAHTELPRVVEVVPRS